MTEFWSQMKEFFRTQGPLCTAHHVVQALSTQRLGLSETLMGSDVAELATHLPPLEGNERAWDLVTEFLTRGADYYKGDIERMVSQLYMVARRVPLDRLDPFAAEMFKTVYEEEKK